MLASPPIASGLLHLRVTTPLSVASGTTSHPGYRPMKKRATIHASFGFFGGIPLQ
jgi:hypothetical protein